MEDFLVVGLILLVVIGLYLSTYLLNKNTEKPQDTEILKCGACSSLHCNVRDKKEVQPDKCEIEGLN
ncbi:MAG: hypothetical protein K9L74_05865 [Candidatus Izimaplasma sp.]|nr:hypothetical protein [Candidatus Izimaplasma bacterium]